MATLQGAAFEVRSQREPCPCWPALARTPGTACVTAISTRAAFCASCSCCAMRSSVCQCACGAGVVLEAFGVGNMPDANSHGWLPWLQRQTKQGVKV